MGNFSTVYNKESSPANDNNLITVVKTTGYSSEIRVLCVAAKEAAHMGYYMSKLYRHYFRATGFSELEEEIENTRQGCGTT